MLGKISVGIVAIDETPRRRIKMDATMNVYGRFSASLTIHIDVVSLLAYNYSVVATQANGTLLRPEEVSLGFVQQREIRSMETISMRASSRSLISVNPEISGRLEEQTIGLRKNGQALPY
jgi:hypothetical protein